MCHDKSSFYLVESILKPRDKTYRAAKKYLHQKRRVCLRFFIFSLLIPLLVLGPIALTPTYAIDVPELLSPDNYSITTPDSENYPPLAIPEFKWKPVEGATKYRLQVSGVIGFSTTIVNIKTANTSYTPINARDFSDGDYYWRVRVEAPDVGQYSEPWEFSKLWATDTNKPELTTPLDGATVDFFDHPIFSWQPVMGAAEYKLQIYASSGGWATPTYTVTTLATTHQPKDKLLNGTYYWRVVPVDPAGNYEGTPSEERSFTVNYNPTLALLSPENKSNPTFTPTFQWTAVRGAEFYRLQYSTDPSFSTEVTEINTRNTSHTPISTMPNDVNYYWRVRVISGDSLSDWAGTWSFVKRWYIKPTLLTPTNNYQHQRFPFLSWTPVPGAGYYKIDISKDIGFISLYISDTTANTFYTPSIIEDSIFYWRVTPYDGSRKAGVSSNTSSFKSSHESLAPHQVYPQYYYTPNSFPGFDDVTTNPVEDRTVPYPIFTWHRVTIPPGQEDQGQIYPEAYRLQVSSDATFSSIDWSVDTQNSVATPTATNPFTPTSGFDYFWRVCPLIGGVEAGPWSQVWKTRFDSELSLDETGGESPELIRPTTGFEFAESTPLLEWFPLVDAESYDVEISLDADFSPGDIVDQENVSIPAYAPTQSFAQRNLGAVDFNIYYWRVKDAEGITWSAPRMFQVAAQSQWQVLREPGNPENRLQIGSDPTGDIADADYDLISLHASQSRDDWFFGFHVPPSPGKDVTYGLYFDLDHKIASGASFDARGYDVDLVNSVYQPEYAVYVLQKSGSFSANEVYLYRWNGSSWDTVNILGSIGGDLTQDGDYVELMIPNTAIGHQDNTGSYAIALLSFPAEDGSQPQDSVPSNPNIPGTNIISRFSNVTERLNLIMPPNDAGVDPTTFPTVQPFFWDWPPGTPWTGVTIEVYLDPEYTTLVDDYIYPTSYYRAKENYAQTAYAWEFDLVGDNTYYWRVKPLYIFHDERRLLGGSWSQGWRFERQGFIPTNLDTSVEFATPSFSWDLVDGAKSYDLQVSTQENFGTTVIDINTKQTSYTSITTLASGSYYWRVRAHRTGSSTSDYSDVKNDWSEAKKFTLQLPPPEGLTPISGEKAEYAPTLCWTPLINYNDPDPVDPDNPLIPVLAAWKYRVQVSKDPSFSTIFDTIDTEQSCWTPIKGYDDGQYHWRVAMIDGNRKLGNYSTPNTFTKQYPQTTLINPTSGSTVAETPTFIWAPVDGAAKYRLEVSLYDTFSPTYESITTNNTRYTPIKTYETSKEYYWRVAIIDDDGKIGPFVGEIVYIDPLPYKVFLPMIIK